MWAPRCSCWQIWALLASLYPWICQFKYTGARVGNSELRWPPSTLRFANSSTQVLVLTNLSFTTLPTLWFANLSTQVLTLANLSLATLHLPSDSPKWAPVCSCWQIWPSPPFLYLNLPIWASLPSIPSILRLADLSATSLSPPLFILEFANTSTLVLALANLSAPTLSPPLSSNLSPPQPTSLSTFVFANASKTESTTIIFICIPTC